MQVAAGARDTEITFQQASVAKDATYRTQTKTWANLASHPTEWAEVQDILPSRAEGLEDGIDITRRPCRVRMLYRSDITAQMRVVIGGRTLEIVSGPVALGSPGRPDGLELICQQVSTQGDTP